MKKKSSDETLLLQLLKYFQNSTNSHLATQEKQNNLVRGKVWLNLLLYSIRLAEVF